MNAKPDFDKHATREKYKPEGETPKEKRSKPILRLPTPYSGKPTPPRQWLFGQHYIRGFVSGTFAPGARGKSIQVLLDSVAMATGYHHLALPGDLRTQKEPLRVWYVNAEDPLEESERRVEAILKHYRLKFSDLGGRLFLDSGREHDCVFVKDHRNGAIVTPVVEGVIEGIDARKIDVLTTDPLVAFHRVPENDNGKMDSVLQEFKDIADWTQVSVEIVGHTRKTDGDEVKLEDVRAATSIVNAVRNLRLLNGMTPQEAEKFSVGELERRSYYRFDEGKPNLKRPGGFSTWMKVESVVLDSGEEVGVPESWSPPRNEQTDSSLVAAAAAPLAPLTVDDWAVLTLITDHIMKCKPVVYGEVSPNSPPKLFSKGIRGGRQQKARQAEVYGSVERLIGHGKLHIEDGHTSSGNAARMLRLGPRVAPVVRDPNAPRGARPWDGSKAAKAADDEKVV